MKKLLLVFLCVCFCLTGTAGAAGLKNWPSRPMGPTLREVDTVVCVEDLHFMSCDEIEYGLGIPAGELKGLTLTRLPDKSHGELTLDGVEAPLYERLDREEVDRLVYEPADAFVTGRIAFIPEYGSYLPAVMSVTAVKEAVECPTLWGEAAFTLTDMPLTGTLAATDQLGGLPTLKVVRQPHKGRVHLEGDRYIYTPQTCARGSDSFTIVAVDSRGVYSEPCDIHVEIQRYTGIRFADLDASLYAAEATLCVQLGFMDGRQVGDTRCFDPDDTLTGAQFLAAVAAAMGKATEPDNAVAVMQSYVDNYSFDRTAAITTADAIRIVSRAAGTEVKAMAHLPDRVSEVPVSSLSAYVSLRAAGLLPGGPGPAPTEAVTRDYAAALVYRLYTWNR